jgi:hypothetical protein
VPFNLEIEITTSLRPIPRLDIQTQMSAKSHLTARSLALTHAGYSHAIHGWQSEVILFNKTADFCCS